MLSIHNSNFLNNNCIKYFQISDVENLRGPKLKEPLKNETIVRKQRAILEGTFIADPVPEAKWLLLLHLQKKIIGQSNVTINEFKK